MSASTSSKSTSSHESLTSIRVTGIDPGTRNLAFCWIEWRGPVGSCSFQHFWDHLYIHDVEIIDIFEDNELVCKSIKSAKPQKLIEAMSLSIFKRKAKLLPSCQANCYDLVRIEQQPTKNIKTKVLSSVMSSILFLYAKENNPAASVDFQSATAKLNVLTTAAQAFKELGSLEDVKLIGTFKRRRTKEQKKDSAKEYRVRKKEAVTKAIEALRLMKSGPGVDKMRKLLMTTGKKDDASDGFLHAVYACQEKYQKIFAKRKVTKAKTTDSIAKKPKQNKIDLSGKKRKRKDESSSDDDLSEDDSVIDMTKPTKKFKKVKVKESSSDSNSETDSSNYSDSDSD